jgi:hypothetical protein
MGKRRRAARRVRGRPSPQHLARPPTGSSPPFLAGVRVARARPMPQLNPGDSVHGWPRQLARRPVAPRVALPTSHAQRAAAARARAAAQMTAMQQAAGSTFASSSSTDATTEALHETTASPARVRAQALVTRGDITTGVQARQGLRQLSPLREQHECDDLLEALETEYANDAINLQTYRMYADELSSIRFHLPAVAIDPAGQRRPAANLNNALAAIRGGMPLEESRQIFRSIRHPDDVAELEAAAQLGVVDRAPARNLINALADIRRGMPLEQARQIFRSIQHPDDVAELEAAAASRAASA